MADQEHMTDQDPTQDRPSPDPAFSPSQTGTAMAPTDAPRAPDRLHAPDREESDVNTDDAPAQPPEPVSPEVAASLSDALRTMYDTVVDEPLPDAFAQLLSRLDDTDG